ncbi:MAG: GntR family transcriptional regulator [Erysipelotrichaceae bacterium]|nr:MAG: GntR family transcriptional [Erysipelotrichaceae bacterium]TXT19653.1 MAG: GntR family transcriptional regulator [Erysipelotrichaceae bacterium]
MDSFQNTQPIYLQIMMLMKRQIATSVLSPGQLLDTVRDLALTYQVNPNTVQRALSELEREGLVKSDRTIGRYVTHDLTLIQKLHQDLFDEATLVFINTIKALHMSNESVINAITNRLKGENT